ncbi:hypothetical protein C0991_002116 [Blastosporella zonata]|nr:hypothetical protein C0991_002116 [Blastosporella zonata]
MWTDMTAHRDKKPNTTGSAVVSTTTVAAILDPVNNNVNNETAFHTSDEDIDMFPDKYVIPKPLHWVGSINTPNALISESLAT